MGSFKGVLETIKDNPYISMSAHYAASQSPLYNALGADIGPPKYGVHHHDTFIDDTLTDTHRVSIILDEERAVFGTQLETHILSKLRLSEGALPGATLQLLEDHQEIEKELIELTSRTLRTNAQLRGVIKEYQAALEQTITEINRLQGQDIDDLIKANLQLKQENTQLKKNSWRRK